MITRLVSVLERERTETDFGGLQLSMSGGDGVPRGMPHLCSAGRVSVPWTQKYFFAEKNGKCPSVYQNLERKRTVALWKTAWVFASNLGLPCRQNRAHSWKLTCLSAFVSEDGLVGRQGCGYRSNGVRSFLLMSALWPHTVAPLLQFYTLLETVIIGIHVFALLSSRCTFQNVTSSVMCLSYCWLHIFKRLRLRLIGKTSSLTFCWVLHKEMRGPLSKPILCEHSFMNSTSFLSSCLPNRTAQLAVVAERWKPWACSAGWESWWVLFPLVTSLSDFLVPSFTF